MARTALEVQRITLDGFTPAFTAANVDGHSVSNDRSDVFLYVKNGSASAMTVTIVTPQTVLGLAVADKAISVAAGSEVVVGKFPRATFGSSLTVDFSAVTSVTVAALSA